MFDKFFYHKDDFVAYLDKPFSSYDFKAFYLVCYILHDYQELVWVDFQYNIVWTIIVFCEERANIVQTNSLLADIHWSDQIHLVHIMKQYKNVGTGRFMVLKNKCNRKTVWIFLEKSSWFFCKKRYIFSCIFYR